MHKIPEKSMLNIFLLKFRRHSHSYTTRFSHVICVNPIPTLLMIVNIKFLQRTISLEQHFHTTDSQITDVSKLKAVTKSKLLSLEKEVSFSNF